MRKSNVLVLLTAITLAPATALAQSGPTMNGTCSGSDASGGQLAGTVGLAVPQYGGGYATVATAQLPYLFGAAECQCATQDIALEINVTQAFGNSDAPATVEVWVGSGCDDYTTRTTPGETACEQLKTGVPSFTSFTTASTSGTTIHIPIPSQALFSPITHSCSPTVASNGVYVLILNDPTKVEASCTLTSLTEQSHGPTAASQVQAVGNTASVTGGVNISWVAPPQSSFSPTHYQILCADEAGDPEDLFTTPADYSICSTAGIERRPIATVGTSDPPQWPASGTFASLDQRYHCGGASATATQATLLLDPTKPHQIEVLAVDNFGNVTAAPVVTSTSPPPVTGNDMGGVFGNDMGTGTGTGEPTHSHGCSLGGPAASSPSGLLFVLFALGGFVIVRRSRRRL